MITYDSDGKDMFAAMGNAWISGTIFSDAVILSGEVTIPNGGIDV